MSDREAFYRAAIGPKNQAYYLSRFLAFDEAGRAGPSWNWAAALLTFFWFIYRRMWAVAFAYLVAANLLAWVIGIVFGVVGYIGLLIGGNFGAFVKGMTPGIPLGLSALVIIVVAGRGQRHGD